MGEVKRKTQIGGDGYDFLEIERLVKQRLDAIGFKNKVIADAEKVCVYGKGGFLFSNVTVESSGDSIAACGGTLRDQVRVMLEMADVQGWNIKDIAITSGSAKFIEEFKRQQQGWDSRDKTMVEDVPQNTIAAGSLKPTEDLKTSAGHELRPPTTPYPEDEATPHKDTPTPITPLGGTDQAKGGTKLDLNLERDITNATAKIYAKLLDETGVDPRVFPEIPATEINEDFDKFLMERPSKFEMVAWSVRELAEESVAMSIDPEQLQIAETICSLLISQGMSAERVQEVLPIDLLRDVNVKMLEAPMINDIDKNSIQIGDMRG